MSVLRASHCPFQPYEVPIDAWLCWCLGRKLLGEAEMGKAALQLSSWLVFTVSNSIPQPHRQHRGLGMVSIQAWGRCAGHRTPGSEKAAFNENPFASSICAVMKKHATVRGFLDSIDSGVWEIEQRVPP